MRYEHLTIDLSTAACDELVKRLTNYELPQFQFKGPVSVELANLRNELTARLQHRDQDPNYTPPEADWLAE
jgi:hypothetical protein